MHANAALLDRWLAGLRARDAATIASCYHPKARFRDIAFNLRGRKCIRHMWRMICSDEADLQVLDFKVVEADDRAGRVRLVERYIFHSRRAGPKPVTNAIESRFEFENGLIRRQIDECDAKEWARQAMGDGMEGRLAARVRPLRSVVANYKLVRFVLTHRHER